MRNVDRKTVEGFGAEWKRFNQSDVSEDELAILFETYFHIFPWETLPGGAVGFDIGCGSGRWAKKVAPRVGKLYCIDPSEEALDVARENLKGFSNVEFHNASVDDIPVEDGQMDFGYSLGVLHHVPDTGEAIRSCAKKLKKGAPFLVYLYYAFDNRPLWYGKLWKFSDFVRRIVSKSPTNIKYILSQCVAIFVYYPLARLSLLLEKLGVPCHNFPLYFYRNTSFYVMRTDAFDRFGTRLEQRFVKNQIVEMLKDSGFENILFSDKPSFWTVVGYKK